MADAGSSPAWIGAVSALGGVVVGLLGPWLTSFSTLKREREARNEARADKEAAEQRQLLLDLQKALQNTLRAACTAHTQDVTVHREQASWEWNMRHEKVLRVHNAGQMQSTILAVRIHDAEIRKMV